MKIILFCFFASVCYCNAQENKISFLKYCMNESNPEPFPTHGSQSSGSLVMSSPATTEPWYLPNLNCSVTLSTEKNFYLLLTFSNISLRNSSMDNLTISYNGGESSIVLAGQQVCSTEDCEGLKFDSGQSSNLTLKFISANVTVPQNVTGFKAHYTVYDLADSKSGACHGKHRFLCGNKHCIWYDSVCDGHNDCGDLSDENKCIIPVPNTVWGIVVIVIAIVSVIIFVPMFIFLAVYGTRSIVKSVTMSNHPTPLSVVAIGETSGLLTSSELANSYWPGSSYERRSSYSYGSAREPSPSVNKKRHNSDSEKQQNDNRVL